MAGCAFWMPWRDEATAVPSGAGEQFSRLVIYDGGCGFCSRSIVVLQRIDLFHSLRFADIATEWEWLVSSYPDLDRDACLTEMHVITRRGEIHRGFDAYRSLAWVLFFGWPLLPFLYVPGVPVLGRRMYQSVAMRRSTTTCALPRHPRLRPLAPRHRGSDE